MIKGLRLGVWRTPDVSTPYGLGIFFRLQLGGVGLWEGVESLLGIGFFQ